MITKSNSAGAQQMVTSIRLSVDEHAKLKELAGDDRRSLSQELRYLIETAWQERQEQAA